MNPHNLFVKNMTINSDGNDDQYDNIMHSWSNNENLDDYKKNQKE